jgi:hypothetical protein
MDSTTELDGIKQTLEKQNGILQNMLDIMKKPEKKFVQVLQMIILIAGALGILNIVEIIRNWIFGG